MSERRFKDIHLALLRSGVAGRHARHTVRDLKRRFQQLVDEAQGRGESAESARSQAHRLLGTDQAIIDRVASEPGLRAWTRRWPGLIFTITPVMVYIGLVVVTIMGIPTASDWLRGQLSGMHLTAAMAGSLGSLISGFVLWCMPVLVAACFAYLAYRHGVALRWPIAATALVCGLAALGNFSYVVNPTDHTGSVSAGLGWSLGTLPGQGLRALVTALIVIVPLLAATRSTRTPPLTGHSLGGA